jgi:biopolymer transport protein ExbD
MTRTRESDGEFGFQIAPMLDVLFVLLLFFMVVAGAQKVETEIKVPLPGHGTGPLYNVPVTLEISADGQVTFNGVETDLPADHQLPQTTARLKAVMAEAPERPVYIQPAPSTHHQRVMDVLDMCKAVHIQNLAFSPNSD